VARPQTAVGRSYLAPKTEGRNKQGRGQQRKQRQGKGQGKTRSTAEEQSRVTEPLTPKGVRQETRASTNLRFRPLERAISGDIRASKQRVSEQGDWWQSYLNQVNAGQADTSAAYAQAAATGQAQIGQASAIDTANTERLQGEAAKSADLRGVAPTTAPAEREAASQAQRNYLSAAQGNATAQMGANQRGYLNEQKRIGVGQSIASRQAEQRRERTYRSDLRDTRKERGDYATTKRGELRQGERDYLIQRGAFGLDKKKATQEAREGARDAQENATERAEKRRQQKIENRQKQRDLRIKEEGGGKSPAEKREIEEGRQNAAAKAQQLVKAHGWPKTAKEWADLEEAVAKESEVSPADAARIIKRLKTKHASSAASVGKAVQEAAPGF
jgi:predicted DNA binding CopG/RHH family protein